MIRSIRYRLYPNSEQKVMLEKHFGCARFVYNWGLGLKIKTWEEQKKDVSCYELSKLLTQLKHMEGMEWLGEVSAQSIHTVLKDLEIAFRFFFRKQQGFPRFKSKSKSRKSFRVPQHGRVNDNSVYLPKIGNVRAVISRQLVGRIKRITVIKLPTGKYFASVIIDDGVVDPTPSFCFNSSNVVGIDLGIKDFAVLSTGERIPNPKPLSRNLRKLRRLQRAMGRKQKGSHNREKCRHRYVLLCEKITNQRDDFQHKLSNRIVRENQAIALETLNISGMKKSVLSFEISDVAWGQFARMIEYKARRLGKSVFRIHRCEPSSRMCTCGFVNRSLTLRDRTWKCVACGAVHDRDVLAANNIKRMGVRDFVIRMGNPDFKLGEIGKGWFVNQEFKLINLGSQEFNQTPTCNIFRDMLNQ